MEPNNIMTQSQTNCTTDDSFTTPVQLEDETISQSNSSLNSQANNIRTMTLKEFWLHDDRLDRKFNYNRIDRNSCDANLLMACELEIEFENMLDGRLKYTLENRYHLIKKVKVYRDLKETYNNMCANLETFESNNSKSCCDQLWKETKINEKN
jgi:hypothetical protein